MKPILSIPPEIHVQIKSYLSNEDLKSYNLTCILINYYFPSEKELVIRKCGKYDLTKYQIKYKIDKTNDLLRCGHLECVKFLFEKGELTIEDLRSPNDADWVLRWASQEGHFEIVKYFMEGLRSSHGESLTLEDLRSPSGYNFALRFASSAGRLEIVKYFMEGLRSSHGETLTIEDLRSPHGVNALTLASQYGHLEIVKYFQNFI